MTRIFAITLALILGFASAPSHAFQRDQAGECTVTEVERLKQPGLPLPSPDGTKFLVNIEDKNGIPQIYIGNSPDDTELDCITCTKHRDGPSPGKFKMQVQWHPSGDWIIMAAEQEKFDRPWYATDQLVEGWLQCGIWVDMFAVSPDGSKWQKLVDYGPKVKADGFTGPAFTPDGKHGVWAQIVDGNVFKYSFGKWELIMADFEEVDGVPRFTNFRNITPADTFWVEPGNFHPNGRELLLSADTGFPDHSKVQGQDQYILDVFSGEITNLTNTPVIWDEHGLFSPDGKKIIFMSSIPYPDNSTIWNIKTEFMMMDKDGSNLQRVTHYFDKNAPEYHEKNGIAAVAFFNPEGTAAYGISLVFPKYQYWKIHFKGNCGAND